MTDRMKIAVRRLNRTGTDIIEEDVSDCCDVTFGEGSDRIQVLVSEGSDRVQVLVRNGAVEFYGAREFLIEPLATYHIRLHLKPFGEPR
jgi:hypothetical protein